MNNIFKQKIINVDADGQIVEGPETSILEESNAIKVISIVSPNVRNTIAEYKALDEDELFDYEKTVIPFTFSRVDSYRTTALAIIIEDGVISIEDSSMNLTDDLEFSSSFSKLEFQVAVESQVHELTDNHSIKLTWIQSQQPGAYKTPEGVYSVFKDKEGRMNYVLEGSHEVWFSPKTPNDTPILNEKLTGEIPKVSESIEELKNSEAFRRLKEALSNN